ncbi:cell division protein FtsA [Lacticaseibacillus hulanensis]|uniref:cell division protein FtsA n=1 Tax=Lacticaseibacillus hulanensis TaxID=2493111 RepID=UPI000FDCCBD0|nr:cell division protein FtsA [Lacticaseibacillus hulanensis]
MGNQDIYVGLDIGTTSIKVIAAEITAGQLSVIGVGSQRADGMSRGVIVDIDKTAATIRAAAQQAADKTGITIHNVVVGVPASLLQIEQVSGMIAVGDTSKEITADDVRNVASTALTRNLPPERTVLSLTPDEFVVDGFDGINDPRGMIGVRLEMHGLLFTVPKTVLHNLRRAVEKAGLAVEMFIAAPQALGEYILSDGEKDFGTVVIDLGGGQSTAAVIHDRKLKFTTTDLEGGEYVTKDISVVLNTSFPDAERLKREYGTADTMSASEEQTFPVTVVGKSTPVTISEKYLAEIIEARLAQIFTRLNDALDSAHALDLPGGIVITGGDAAMPGVSALADDIFGRQVKLYVPSEVGLRHPAFTQALALVHTAANLSDINRIVASALKSGPVAAPEKPKAAPVAAAEETRQVPDDDNDDNEPAKKKEPFFKRFFGTFFD